MTLLSAVTENWENAAEIAARARITHKSAAKRLRQMAREGKIDSDVDEWVDGKYRRRQRMLYKLIVIIDWGNYPAWMGGR